MLAFIWPYLHFLYSSLYHQNWKPANYISQTPLLAGFQLRICQRLETGWQKEGYNTFPASGYVCSSNKQLWRTAGNSTHTTGSSSISGALVSGFLLNCGNMAPSSSVSADSWAPALRQLSDLWLRTPFSLVLPPTHLLSSFCSSSPSTTSVTNPSLLEVSRVVPTFLIGQ